MENSVKEKRLVVAVVSADSGVGRAVLRGIAVVASRHGWMLETIDPSISGDDFSPFSPLLGKADGVVVRTGDIHRRLRACLREDAPVVGIDIAPFPDSGLWAVLNPDNVRIGAMAAEELLTTRRKCFAFVPALPSTPWGDARDRGFCDRIRAAGCDVRRYEPHAAWRGVSERDALARWLAELPRPFGLFTRNDVLAKFALGACKSAGLAVPEDAAVIGADDDETICLYSVPPLSSVRIDHEGGGRRAAEALHGFFGKPKPARTAAMHFGPYGVARRPSTGAAAPGCDLRFAAGLDFIASHFGSPLVGAEDIAAAMGLGRRQAERLFRANGTSIRQRLEETRLARVKTLLATTGMPLRRIAGECGFSSEIYLSGLFRKRLGVSPGAWRRLERGE